MARRRYPAQAMATKQRQASRRQLRDSFVGTRSDTTAGLVLLLLGRHRQRRFADIDGRSLLRHLDMSGPEDGVHDHAAEGLELEVLVGVAERGAEGAAAIGTFVDPA